MDFVREDFRLIIVLSAALFTLEALSAVPPAPSSTQCQLKKSGELQYLASFELKGEPGRKSALELRVGKGSSKGWIAEIVSDNNCEAVCYSKEVEKNEAQELESLDMKCKSKGIDALSAPATLLLSTGRGKAPVLRFGSWLEGYREAMLQVQLDRLRIAK